MVGSSTCSTSSVCELETMESDLKSKRKSAGGGGAGGKLRSTGRIDLSCREETPPSDSEGDGGKKKEVRGKGNKWVDMLNGIAGNCQIQRVGSGGGNSGGSSGANGLYKARATPVLYVGSQGPSKSVPLGGVKSATVARIGSTLTPRLPPSAAHESGVAERRKRRPRLDISLRMCKDFVMDLCSKKHKDWSWPFVKQDKETLGKFMDPVYLYDVRKKLEDRVYSNVDEFSADMRKLVDNFKRAYSPEHTYYKGALKLNGLLEEELQKIKEAVELTRSPGCKGPAPPLLFGESFGNASRSIIDLGRKPRFSVTSSQPCASWGGHCAPPPAGGLRNNASISGNLPNDGMEESTLEQSGVNQEDLVSDSGENGDSEQSGESGGSTLAVSSSTPTSKRGRDEVGGQGKRARVEEHAVDLSVVKEEVMDDGVITPPINRNAVSLRMFACRWIMEGIRQVLLMEHVLPEIKSLIGVREEEVIIDLGILQGIDDDVLTQLAQFLISVMIGRRQPPPAASEPVSGGPVPESSGNSRVARRVATEALTTNYETLAQVQLEIETFQTTMFQSLMKLHQMQGRNLESMMKTRESIGTLMNSLE